MQNLARTVPGISKPEIQRSVKERTGYFISEGRLAQILAKVDLTTTGKRGRKPGNQRLSLLSAEQQQAIVQWVHTAIQQQTPQWECNFRTLLERVKRDYAVHLKPYDLSQLLRQNGIETTSTGGRISPAVCPFKMRETSSGQGKHAT